MPVVNRPHAPDLDVPPGALALTYLAMAATTVNIATTAAAAGHYHGLAAVDLPARFNAISEALLDVIDLVLDAQPYYPSIEEERSLTLLAACRSDLAHTMP